MQFFVFLSLLSLHVLGAKHVQIVSDGFVRGEWVVAGIATNFTVEVARNSSGIIPQDTYYSWLVVPASNVLPPVTQTGHKMFSYSFPQHGHYDLIVVGNHSAGSFSAQHMLSAECKLSEVYIILL